MFGSSSDFESQVYENTPNMSLMFTMYTPTFGNGGFVLQPANPAKTGNFFPTIPYLPLEALIYQQQSSNPNQAPTNILSGQSSGEQLVMSQQTAQDSVGTTRYQLGYQAG